MRNGTCRGMITILVRFARHTLSFGGSERGPVTTIKWNEDGVVDRVRSHSPFGTSFRLAKPSKIDDVCKTRLVLNHPRERQQASTTDRRDASDSMQSVDAVNQPYRRYAMSVRDTMSMLASRENHRSTTSGITRSTNPRGSTMSESEMPDVVARLDQLDRKVGQLLDLITKQKTIKDFYTTAEVAEIVGRSEFTVREYCRLGRIKGQKRACGRGKHPAWIVAHAELERFRNEGLLPLRKAEGSEEVHYHDPCLRGEAHSRDSNQERALSCIREAIWSTWTIDLVGVGGFSQIHSMPAQSRTGRGRSWFAPRYRGPLPDRLRMAHFSRPNQGCSD
jgi:Helix-turn-helix domain